MTPKIRPLDWEVDTILLDVMNQICYDDGMFDSLALSAYADALRYLAKQGWVKITSEYGRRVIAKPTAKLVEYWTEGN